MDSNEKEKIVVSVDPDFEEIIPGFLEHRREDIKKILEALDGNDFEGIRIIGHTMKGVGGGYGFDAISDIGRFIEAAAKENRPEDIRQHTEELASYIDRVEVVYE
ncbi:MAG: Hpt domain-containing protein [Nitrospira sp.]|nr:Hpt domain-containing protein [bacterium]MBL7049419.1 Hpt domain-containing protein [Nitrospira sp.]